MRNYLFLSSCAALAAPLSAQDSAKVPVITVTATGTPVELEDTGQPVSIISREEIELVQGADITRVLQRVPGVTFSRNGGTGAFTGVRLRGAEAEQVLVLIDGVRVNDPASPAGGFDFGNLLPGTIDQIDLLRGSNSTVWGSDAIGGVLAVKTRSTSGVEGSAEYGARDSFNANVSGSIESETGFLSVAGGYHSTDGFSSAAGGTEADGFEQFALTARGRVFLSATTEIFASGRFADGTLDIDGFPAPTYSLADTPEYQGTTQYSGALGLLHDNGPLYVQAAYSFADTERSNFDPSAGPAPGFTSDGHSDRIEVKGEYRVIGPLLVNFGADAEWTSLETNFNARQDTRILGGYVQAGIEFGALSAHLGVRQDDHARFGGATSFGADISYEIAPELRLKASIGEGFKAPSLFQLLSDFGNSLLRPEESTSFDLGLAWRDRGAPSHAGVTLFRRDSDDLIQFVSCFGVVGGICIGRPFGTYDNIAAARAQGIEIEAGTKLFDTVRVNGVYSFVDAEDRASGNLLARRPRHAATLSVDWITGLELRADTKGLAIGADLRLVGSAFDDVFNNVRIAPYEVLDLRASLPVGNKIELFARVENVFDADYQTAAGYAQAGRGAFGGVRFDF